MILNDAQIAAAVRDGDIVIDPFDERQVQAATYDLRIGPQGATTSSKKIVDVRERGYIALEPGDFGVVTVLEELRLGPQYAARFGLRSKFARKGLIATTGPQIDPGYHGRLIVGITNLTPRPVSLPYKDDFLSVEFHRLEEPSEKPYEGPYQHKLELGAEEIEFITESQGMALSDMLTTLRSLSENVHELAAEFKAFKWLVPITVGVATLIIGAIAIAVAVFV